MIQSVSDPPLSNLDQSTALFSELAEIHNSQQGCKCTLRTDIDGHPCYRDSVSPRDQNANVLIDVLPSMQKLAM